MTPYAPLVHVAGSIPAILASLVPVAAPSVPCFASLVPPVIRVAPILLLNVDFSTPLARIMCTLALSMGDDAIPPPRNPGITDADWAQARNVLTTLVAKKVGTALEPLPIADEAIKRAQDPKYKAWDPAKQTFIRYLGSIANSLVANELKKLTRRSTDPVDPQSYKGFFAREDNPEEAAIRKERLDTAQARLRKVREALAADPCCLALLDGVEAGERMAFQRAIDAGFTYRQVELARERMQRAALAIVAEETRAARKRGYSS